MAKGSFSAELFIDWNLFRKQRKTLESLSNFMASQPLRGMTFRAFFDY